MQNDYAIYLTTVIIIIIIIGVIVPLKVNCMIPKVRRAANKTKQYTTNYCHVINSSTVVNIGTSRNKSNVEINDPQSV